MDERKFVTANIIKDNPNAVLPQFAYDGDVGADITFISFEKVLSGVYMLDSGLIVEPPIGHYFEMYSRSGIYKTEFIQANQVGIIDPGYRGTIKMPVRYMGKQNADEAVNKLMGKRFAQLILRRQILFNFKEAVSVTYTERGQRGFGSSGDSVLPE